MFINTSKTKIFIRKLNESEDIPYFFLHGFTGTADSWENVIKKHCDDSDILCSAVRLELESEAGYAVRDIRHEVNKKRSFFVNKIHFSDKTTFQVCK